jgi:putative flippase GtrA
MLGWRATNLVVRTVSYLNLLDRAVSYITSRISEPLPTDNSSGLEVGASAARYYEYADTEVLSPLGIPPAEKGVAQPAVTGRHRRPKARPSGSLLGRSQRLVIFGTIGAGVFGLGLALQVALVRQAHLNSFIAYVIQGFISVQISFLLNRFWTWRDVDVPFFSSLAKFNIQKIVTTAANTLIYGWIDAAGVNYVVANVLTTAIFTVINYLSADNWVFAKSVPGHETAGAVPGVSDITRHHLDVGPTVSVVVPCKNNERTILPTVLSLLGQNYPRLEQVVLVGSVGDTTWRALEGIDDRRLVILEQAPGPGRRDPNVKRHRGIGHTSSELVALVDSDIVMQPDWLSRGISMLLERRLQCVAGGMASIHSSFWGRFVDSTTMGAKTPRLPHPYLVTRRNFGKHGRKPPITANVILTRRLYEDCPLDVNWSYGYEDYEWFWRVAKSGYHILFSPELTGKHHHRRGFMPLCKEYLQSSDGCARFIRRHPDCPLAAKRRRQAYLLPVAAAAAAFAALLAMASGFTAAVGAVLAIGAIGAATREYLGRRSAEALLYLPLNLILGSLFIYGMLRALRTSGREAAAVPAVVASNQACA